MLVVLGLTVGADPQRPAAQAAAAPRRGGQAAGGPGSTDQRVARSAAAVRDRPSDADRLVALGSALLQKARETGDASYYLRADQALATALASDASNAGAYTDARRAASRAPRLPRRAARRPARAQAGTGRRQALRRGRRRQRRAGALRRGRPGAAADDRPEAQPRRLRPRLLLPRAARRPARRARSARPGAGSRRRGARERRLRPDPAGQPRARARPPRRRASARIARRSPASPATSRPARASRASTRPPGASDSAISRLRPVVARLPLPEYVVLLGETELAAGRGAAARRTFGLVRVQQRLLAGAGFDTDVELAIFEADHGDRARGVTLARAAWRSAPSVRSADALGWALTRAGRPAAGPRVGTPRAAPRLTRRAVPLPRGHERPRGRPSARRPRGCCAVRCVPTRASPRCTRPGRAGR